MERTNLIYYLGTVLTRNDNGEQYLVTELGLLKSSDSEPTLSFVRLVPLSSNSYLETNDFELLQKLFNISDISDLQRHFSDGKYTYGVIEVSSNMVAIRRLRYDFETRDIQTIEIYEDLNDRMINGSYSQRYGFCSLDYFIKNFHEVKADECICCDSSCSGISLGNFELL